MTQMSCELQNALEFVPNNTVFAQEPNGTRWGRRYSSTTWSSNFIGGIYAGGNGGLLPNSISHYHANEPNKGSKVPLRPSLSPKTRSSNPTNVNMHKSERGRMWFDYEHAYAYMRKRWGELGIGDRTARRWVGHSELGGLSLGGGCTLGMGGCSGR